MAEAPAEKRLLCHLNLILVQQGQDCVQRVFRAYTRDYIPKLMKISLCLKIREFILFLEKNYSFLMCFLPGLELLFAGYRT